MAGPIAGFGHAPKLARRGAPKLARRGAPKLARRGAAKLARRGAAKLDPPRSGQAGQAGRDRLEGRR